MMKKKIYNDILKYENPKAIVILRKPKNRANIFCFVLDAAAIETFFCLIFEIIYRFSFVAFIQFRQKPTEYIQVL